MNKNPSLYIVNQSPVRFCPLLEASHFSERYFIFREREFHILAQERGTASSRLVIFGNIICINNKWDCAYSCASAHVPVMNALLVGVQYFSNIHY